MVDVRLKRGSSLDDLLNGPAFASKYGGAAILSDPNYTPPFAIRRTFDDDEDKLDALAAADATLPNLKLWHTFVPAPGIDLDDLFAYLEESDKVDVAEKTTRLLDPPLAVSTQKKQAADQKMAAPAASLRQLQLGTPDFLAFQNYLQPAPIGIDAEYAWTLPGGTGAGVKVTDIEYSWQQTHEDLMKVNGLPLHISQGLTPENPWPDSNHGTAVLGELVGDSNGLGVKGICYDADVGLAPELSVEEGYIRGKAITQAVLNGSPGDVILLEMQDRVCGIEADDDDENKGYGPAEWSQVVFDATRTAVANGHVVVAAAGNGNVNLDDPICEGKFDLANPERDSGAIIVGAGAPPDFFTPREKLDFSSYGARVDVQGHGAFVYTTGYGDLFDAGGDEDRKYTKQFAGTSSASPIVAGAAVIMQSIAKEECGRVLAPRQIREASFPINYSVWLPILPTVLTSFCSSLLLRSYAQQDLFNRETLASILVPCLI